LRLDTDTEDIDDFLDDKVNVNVTGNLEDSFSLEKVGVYNFESLQEMMMACLAMSGDKQYF